MASTMHLHLLFILLTLASLPKLHSTSAQMSQEATVYSRSRLHGSSSVTVPSIDSSGATMRSSAFAGRIWSLLE